MSAQRAHSFYARQMCLFRVLFSGHTGNMTKLEVIEL